MFDIGWGEILVLVIAGLFILGPERLPGAARWLGQTIRQVREYATGASNQLRNELGPEFDELRKPLEDLNQLRSFNPRTAITQSLFGGDQDPLGLNGLRNDLGRNGSNGSTPNGGGPASFGGGATPLSHRPLDAHERAPYDPDAT